MQRIYTFFFIIALMIGLTASVAAHPGLEAGHEHIVEFNENIWINTDGSIKVEEKIVYDFGHEERRGIIRHIPVTKTNNEGTTFKMAFDVTGVVDEKGAAYTYDATEENDTLTIKIGDANRTITGQHTYIITYTVIGALTYFSDHDELYWNATGNEWNIPIALAKSTIYLPSAIATDKIRASCYSGFAGSTQQNCTAAVQANSVVVSSNQALETGQGMTVVVGFPTGIVSIVEPTEVKAFFTTFWGKVTLGMLIIASVLWYILLPLWLPIKWWLSGRDPHVATGPVSAWFDPPQTKSKRPLTPAETGTLVDEHAAIREISALIINLAQRGYLKIVEKGTDDFEFIKTKDISKDESLQGFEKTFLTGIFSGKEVLRLKEAKLATQVEKAQHLLYESLVKEGYFPENPDKIRKRYAVLAGIAAVTFNFFLLISASVFGRLMPRKTLEGVHATAVAKSLKNFLASQERQLEFQAKNQMMFEKLLPFAVAFGVEKVWAERFKDITLTPPEWFVGTQAGVFNSQTFTRGLGASMSSFKSAATPVTSSTGHSSGFSGGSSGGGGGGGGGGSW